MCADNYADWRSARGQSSIYRFTYNHDDQVGKTWIEFHHTYVNATAWACISYWLVNDPVGLLDMHNTFRRLDLKIFQGKLFQGRTRIFSRPSIKYLESFKGKL